MSKVGRILLGAGLAAPVVYLVTVVVGGWLTPEYSHLQQPVSALFESGAALALPISAAFVAYNLLLIAFAAGVWLAMPTAPMRLAAVMIVLNGLCGLVIELFPMDPVGAAVTPAGLTHMVIAGLLVLTCTGAMLAGSIGWRGRASPAFVNFNWALLVLMLVTGALAAMSAAQAWPLVGLSQRLTIGSYLVWVFITAVAMLRHDPSPAAALPA